jgi:competence protein ComEA
MHRFWLRRADQASVAAFVVLGLAGSSFWWSNKGGDEALVEFEQARTQETHLLVNVNGAAWPELTQLPGIGETLARRIVDSREREGLFSNHDDLRRVKGIGRKTVEHLRPFLCPIGEKTTEAAR